MSIPSIKIFSFSTSKRRRSSFASVLFPDPVLPTIAIDSPSDMFRFIFFNASTGEPLPFLSSGYEKLRFLISMLPLTVSSSIVSLLLIL